MKIVVLRKGQFEGLPQIMSLAIVARELGHEIVVLTSQSEQKTKDRFTEKGITVIDLCPEQKNGSANIFEKVKHWRTFSIGSWKYIDEKAKGALLWISTADSALALGRRLLRENYILHLRELYDQHFVYRYLLSQYARKASCVVVPEFSRACIFRYWYDLEMTPVVLPNKSTNHPRRSKLEVEDAQARKILGTIKKNEKIVIYQGGIRSYSGLHDIAKAVDNLGDGWRFIVMGAGDEDYLQTLKYSYQRLIHIPKVTAPYHLQVTSHAYIGVATYSFDALNNIFCAPNKTWEAMGFGLPMICNDVPAMRTEIQENNAGLCIDMKDSKQIELAIKKIDEHYSDFSKNAMQLFDSVDVFGIIQSVIDIAVSKFKTQV